MNYPEYVLIAVHPDDEMASSSVGSTRLDGCWDCGSWIPCVADTEVPIGTHVYAMKGSDLAKRHGV